MNTRKITQIVPTNGWAALFRHPNGGKPLMRKLICWGQYTDGDDAGVEGISLCCSRQLPETKKANGKPMKRPNDEAMQACRWTSEEQAAEHIEYIRSRYADGDSFDDIALEYNVKGETLRKRLRDFDLVEYRKSKEAARIARDNKRKGEAQPSFMAGWCDLEPTFICYIEPQ